jgi:hypothetical protein
MLNKDLSPLARAQKEASKASLSRRLDLRRIKDIMSPNLLMEKVD